MTNKEHRGVPVGAVRIKALHTHAWRSLLQQTLGDQAMRFRGVESMPPPSDNEFEDADRQQQVLLVHLHPLVCSALDDGQPDLMDFLKRHLAEYLPGVRRKQLPLVGRIVVRSDVTATTIAQKKQTKKCRFTFAEIFAGIGGFRLGLESLGGKCVVSSEISESAAAIYRQNFVDDACCTTLMVGDILDHDAADLPDFDMLTAGFPCQPFTNRGHQRGLADERGQLYRELVRLLHAKQPMSFMFENVAGLVTIDGGSRGRRERGKVATVTPGRVFERILVAFASCGYRVDWCIINSRHFLPQQRERVYIVGTRIDLDCGTFQWDGLSYDSGSDSLANDKVPHASSSSTVRDILEPKDSSAVLASELNREQWIKVQSLYAKKNMSASCDGCIDVDGKAPTLISQYHRVGSFSTKYLFEEADGTLRIGLLRPRFFTPRECCRLMGFPESFKVPSFLLEKNCETHDVAHFYRGVGNAVTPPVVSAIAMKLLDMLGKEKLT